MLFMIKNCLEAEEVFGMLLFLLQQVITLKQFLHTKSDLKFIAHLFT